MTAAAAPVRGHETRSRSEPAHRSERSLAGTALGLLPVQAVLRAGEALLPVLLAAWFGRSPETDLVNLTWALFTLAGSLLFGLFRDSALVPILAEERLARPAELPRVRGALLGHSLLAAASLAALAGAVVTIWFRGHYRDAELALAVALVAPFCAGLLVLTARTFFEAVLQAEGWFRAPPLASALGMGASVGLLAFTRHGLGVTAIPWALLGGDVVALALLVATARHGARLRFPLSLARPAAVRRFARRAASQVAGAAITRLNPLVDQAMAAATGVAGGGTLLRLSQDVGGLPTSLLQAALLPVLLARLSSEHASGREARHRALTARTLAVVGALLAAASVALFALRDPLLRLVYLHGRMDAAGVARLAHILPYHLLGVVPFGLLLVLVRAHTSIGESRIMLGMGVLNAALNVLLNLALRPVLGLEGIALSTSLVSAAVALVLWIRLRRAWARPRRAS